MSLDRGVQSAASTNSRLYLPGETLYGAIAERALELGWTIIPQERGERRISSRIDGRSLKWGEYIDRMPTRDEVRHWANQAPGANGAILLGKASGLVFCFDIDVVDKTLSEAIQYLAEEKLGYTRFARQGQAPKMALFYRVATEEELPPNRAWRFLNAAQDGVGEDLLEIQAKGKLVTAFGYHHKTDRYFEWEGPQPASHATQDVPLVTTEQIESFIDAVQDLRPFHRNASTSVTNATWDSVESDGVRIPKIKGLSANAGFVEDPATGKISDGREAFLWTLALQTARMNASSCHTDEGVSRLQKSVYEEFKERAEISGKWNERYLRDEVSDKVSRAARDVREGRVTEYRERRQHEVIPQETRDKSAAIVAPVQTAEGDLLGFLPPRIGQGKQSARKTYYRSDTTPFAFITEKDEQAYEERKLVPDRTEIASRVQAGLTKALDEVFSEIYDDDQETIKPIHVLKAPTGAGKTSRTINYIAKDPRTKKWDEAMKRGEETPGPILFMLPTYNNIEELRTRATMLNLDPDLNDEDLKKQALEFNIVSEENLETMLADLRRDASNAGLRTMVYMGKVAAGCQMEEKVKLLTAANIGTSGLCKARVTPKDGEPEDKYCVHYSECKAIQQRKEIQNCHVVFIPHAFMTLQIPEELQKVRAVIADERIFPLFVHTTTFSLMTLSKARRDPRLTRKEREAGMIPRDLLQDREQAGEIAHHALTGGRCPAQTLADYVEKRGNNKVIRGADLVRSALRVCGSAISSNAIINPDMNEMEIRELCSKPTGSEISEEFRFWKIIEDRIEMLNMAKLPGSALNPFVKKPRGNREMRIQFLKEENADGHWKELIRISWRSDPNWSGAPLLLLDASASPKIVSKLFGDRPVKVHDIDAPLNVSTILVVDKTYSNSALVAKIGNFKDRAAAGKLKEKMQRILSATSALYGYGRVVCGSSVAFRRAVNTDWAAPSNVDFCHYGATRGLDFAKYHAAAVSFGRMEVPTRTIDGIVAALSYDDEEPEEPFDRNGDGYGPDNQPLRVGAEAQAVPMRNGQDAHIQIPFYPGEWARIVQKQYREEELRQFVGRLRPVYREGEAPVWIAVSKVIPDGIVVDEIVTLDDLIKRNGRLVEAWNAVRRTDGIVSSELAFEASPFVYDSLEDWQDEFARIGFDEVSGRIDPGNRMIWGFTPVKYADDAGEHFAYVRSDISAKTDVLAQHVSDAFAIQIGRSVDVLEVGEPIRSRKNGISREDDTVARELGSLQQRRRDEMNALTTTTLHAVAVSPPTSFRDMGNKSLPRLVTYEFQKEDKKEYMPMMVSELAAVLGTERMWGKVLEGSKDAVSSPVITPLGNETVMGDGSYDDDGM